MPDALHAIPMLLYALLLGNAVLAIVAGVCAAAGRPLPAWFWTVLLLVLAVLVVQVGAGVMMLAGGARPRRALHLLYGLLAVGAGVIQHGLRPGGFLRRGFVAGPARSEARTLALICLTQAALLARAWMTGRV